jgi:WD40 repeat protein
VSARGRRRASTLTAVVSALLAVGIGIPANVVSSNLPVTITEHRALWIALLGGLAAATVVLTLMSQKLSDNGTWPALAGQVPATAGWVERGELAEVVRALTASGRSVALTTGLTGAGGFGKTQLAAQACRHKQVVRHFQGRIVWLTVGQGTGEEDLAARISETIRNLGEDGTAFTGIEQAGQALAAALSARGGGFLLVVDDVWTAWQLRPFRALAGEARLLVTTRHPQVLDNIDPRPHRVLVDQVDAEVAQQILRRGLPPMARATERDLLGLASGYPLLLSLINRRLADDLRAPGGSIQAGSAEAARRLREDGRQALDVTDDEARDSAVAATIDYSLEVLSPADRERYRELGVLPGAEVPVRVVGLLWEGTTGLSQAETAALCDRLDGLSLISLRRSRQVLVMHDVIRDYAGRGLGGKGQAVHAALIHAARSLIEPTSPDIADSTSTEVVPWWRLPRTGDMEYLWQYLTYHLDGAGKTRELDRLCGDLRFAVTRLQDAGPAALEADLARSQSPRVGQLSRIIAQNAHLLGPVRPPGALAAVLTSRLGGMTEMAAQLPALRQQTGAWTAWPDWPLPDGPSNMLLRTLAHGSPVMAVAVAPDSSWLASGGENGTIQVWTRDGIRLCTLDRHPGPVYAMVLAPDGSWLATGSATEVRVWAVEDWSLRISVPGAWELLAVMPDSSRLVVGAGAVRTSVILPTGETLVDDGRDGQSLQGLIRAWGDCMTMIVLTTPPLMINGWASSPKGNWRVVGNMLGEPVSLQAEDGTEQTLAGLTGPVTATAAIAGNGWLATGCLDGSVRVWAEDGSELSVLHGHAGAVRAVAGARDGVLVSGGDDQTVRIWAVHPETAAAPTSHRPHMEALAVAPDDRWLATGSFDGTAELWSGDGRLTRTLGHHRGAVRRVAIAPDGTWLATSDDHGPARVWAAEDGMLLHTLGTPMDEVSARGIYTAAVRTITIAPNGEWLASGHEDGRVQVWAAASGSLLATVDGHKPWTDILTVSSDGRWLASAGSGGSWLSSAEEDETLKLWSTADWTFVRALDGHVSGIRCAAFAPTASLLAVGQGDGSVRIWDADDGSERRTLAAYEGPVRTLAFSHTGQWLASGSSEGMIRVWSLAGNDAESTTAIRVDDTISGCAWSKTKSVLYVAGSRGFYKFSLHPS